MHILFALPVGSNLQIAGTAALDLDAAASLLLDMLHIGATVTNNLGTQVEARHRLQVDGDLLYPPFTL